MRQIIFVILILNSTSLLGICNNKKLNFEYNKNELCFLINYVFDTFLIDSLIKVKVDTASFSNWSNNPTQKLKIEIINISKKKLIFLERICIQEKYDNFLNYRCDNNLSFSFVQKNAPVGMALRTLEPNEKLELSLKIFDSSRLKQKIVLGYNFRLYCGDIRLDNEFGEKIDIIYPLDIK